jgi:predicted GNAT superfamily acetyltransferase
MQETMNMKYGNHLYEMNLHTEYNRSEIRAKQESSRISLGLNTECLNQQIATKVQKEQKLPNRRSNWKNKSVETSYLQEGRGYRIEDHLKNIYIFQI